MQYNFQTQDPRIAMWKLDELHLGLSSYPRHAALQHVSPRRHVTTACKGMARPHVAIVGAGAAGLAAGHETVIDTVE